MIRKNAPEASWDQTFPMEGPVKPPVYEKRLTIRDLFHVLLKRKWIPIGFVVLFVAFAAISSMKAVPTYRTAARIEIGTGNLNVLPFREVVESDRSWFIEHQFNTQYKILQSRSLAEKVAARLTEAGNRQDAGLTKGAVLGMTRIEPVLDSRLVDVVGISTQPAQAARVANMLVDCYIAQDLEEKVAAIRMVTEELGGELEKKKAELDAAEEKFRQYKELNNIVSLNEKQNLVLEELSKLNEAAASARTERLKKEARYNHLKSLSPEQLEYEEDVINNVLVQSLRQKELELLRNIETLAESYGNRHPTMILARSELEEVQGAIDAQILKTVEEVKNAYEKAKIEEERLVKAVEVKKQEVLQFTRRVDQYESLSREVEMNQKLYDEILNRSRETDISERIEKSNVRVVDRAEIPTAPFTPRTKRNVILAIVAGLIIGCGGALFVERLNDKVESPDDVEGYLAKPFLGAVPIIGDRDGYKEVEDKARLAYFSPESTTTEAFKTLLAGIHYSPAANGIKTIVVTSAGPAEGKTTILSNLGIAAAQNGKRVVLIDSDMRRPTLHRIFGLRKEIGFVDYLVGEAGLEHVVQETEVPNLCVVARGTTTPNPSGLISSERMKEFARLVREEFDLVLFDSPPCTVVADPLIMANLADAVVNVTQSGKFSRKMVGRAIDLLDGVKANVLGVVLNEVKERDHRYYYHYYGYKYSYGNKGEGKDRKGRAKEGTSKQA